MKSCWSSGGEKGPREKRPKSVTVLGGEVRPEQRRAERRDGMLRPRARCCYYYTYMGRQDDRSRSSQTGVRLRAEDGELLFFFFSSSRTLFRRDGKD